MEIFVEYVKLLSRPNKRQKNVIKHESISVRLIIIFICLDFLANITFTTSNDGVCSNNLLEILKTEYFAQVTKLGVLDITNDAAGVFEDLVKISTLYSTYKGVIIRSIIA